MILGLPLRVNDLIQIKILDAESPHACVSRVEELTKEEMLIRWPTEGEMRVPICEHQALSISFGHEHVAYEFEAIVRDRILAPIALLAVRPSSLPRCIQRRENVRVRASVPVELSPKVITLASFRCARANHCTISSSTLTISGGGFTIHHHSKIPVGTIFDVKMYLPGKRQKPLIMSARIVRSSTVVSEQGAYAVELGFAYLRIGESDRARIVQHVFGIQRAGARKDEDRE